MTPPTDNERIVVLENRVDHLERMLTIAATTLETLAKVQYREITGNDYKDPAQVASGH